MFMKYRRFYYRRKGTVIFRVSCIVIAFLIGILLTDAKLRPAIHDLAALEAYALSSETVNAAVERVLSENVPMYSELVSINYSENNSITGITTDIVKMNLLKSRVTGAIDSAFENKGKTKVTVSIGTASGITLFSGFGPYIDVTVGFSSSTQTNFENVFESAGINQTQHSVMLGVETDVMLLLAGKRISQKVTTAFCVAQTVIVGSVPNVMVE